MCFSHFRMVLLAGSIWAGTFIVSRGVLADEQLTDFKMVCEKAEVHALGLYEAKVGGVEKSDVRDWEMLFALILDDKNKQTATLRGYLNQRGEKLLQQKRLVEEILNRGRDGLSGDAANLQSELVGMIRRALLDPEFDSKSAFEKLPRTAIGKQLQQLGTKRNLWQTVRLNWEVLAAVFPAVLREFPTDYWTVRVRVRSERDVVLVLSGTENIRWDVEVSPGSRVVGVILCGYGAQCVELFENPVKNPPIIHRAYLSPNGTQRMHAKGEESFGIYDPKRPEFAEFVKGVKGLTGKEFASFQGGYRPKPKEEPFLVPPKK